MKNDDICLEVAAFVFPVFFFVAMAIDALLDTTLQNSVND